MTYHSIKEYFSEYREICNRIDELEIKFIAIKCRLYEPKSPNLNDLKIQVTASKLNLILQKDKVLKQIEELQAIQKTLYDKHSHDIALLDNELERQIIRMIYIDQVDLSDVRKVMPYSYGYLRNLKAKAETNLMKVVTKCDKL